ncbi:MAG: alanine racemase [Alphaproteobacteria bacterium]|nr:alanine racemase [Alphaproteobacteria bacterium]
MALSGELQIDLKALQENYRHLDSLSAKSCETGVSVKANAYGTGTQHVAPALFEKGARRFFVSTLEEGINLRKILPDAMIYILNGFVPKSSEYKAFNLIPVLNSLSDIAAYTHDARLQEKKLPTVIHFDTGMNRLGLNDEETFILDHNHDILEPLEIDFFMSHFASSDEAGNPSTRLQYEKFKRIYHTYLNVKSSLCNSSGIFRDTEYHLDITRPGIAIYGGNPTPETTNPMKAVAKLSVPALQIKNVKKNETCGYNETYCFKNDTALVTVNLGYADGFFRSLSNKGKLFWKNYALPIRGRVSMDTVICDLENVPERDYPKPYDMIEALGPNQSVDTLAKDAGTISYEILTSLGPRYKRSYIK